MGVKINAVFGWADSGEKGKRWMDSWTESSNGPCLVGRNLSGEESVGTNFPSKSMDSLSAQKRAESEESTL